MTSPAAPRTYIDPTALLQIDDPSVGDPPPLTYAEITGRVLIAVTDRPDDPDRYPDLITPDAGRIIFTPVMTQTMASNEALIALTPKVGAFDTNGFVISPDGMPGIWLIDLGDPTLNPNVPRDQGSYRVSFENITAGGVPLRLASFAIHPVADQENDLGVIAPVIPGQGEPMVVGPPGPATTLVVSGTVTGAPGSAADVSISGDPPDQALAFTIPRGDVGPVGPVGPPGAGIPAPGLAVLATNLVTRPNPTAALPWAPFSTPAGLSSVVYQTGDPDVGDYATVTMAPGLTGASGIQTPATVIVGRSYTISAFLRNNGPAPLTVQLTALNIGSGPVVTVPNDGVWRRYSYIAASASQTTGQLRIPTFNNATSTSGTLDVARGSITEGPALLDYFDGNTPGGRWTGATNNSPSELLGPRMGDIQGLIAARTPLELTGTGMPEGVVTAPVGSYYTDTAATNGAIRWIKQTGTGATGWRVLWGDTGNRSLTPANWIINGWASTASNIRRINDQVFLNVIVTPPSDRPAGSNVILNLPVGWRPIPGANMRWAAGLYGLASADLSAGKMAVLQYTNADASIALMSFDNLAANNTIGTLLVWFTNQAWPTTLP